MSGSRHRHAGGRGGSRPRDRRRGASGRLLTALARLTALTALMGGLVVSPPGAHATLVAAEGGGPPGAGCPTPTGPFRPTGVGFSALERGTAVVRVPRRRDGEIGTAPVTRRGKRLVAWDPEGRPGSGVGTVLLNAHTWPDGSALGNRLLQVLRVGDRVRLRGGDGDVACYRVRQRARFPRDRVPASATFRSWGPEQLVIIVCSGTRRGPGDWSHRTVWYADPERPVSGEEP